MDLSLTNAIERFLDHCRIAKRLSPHSIRAYQTDLAHFAAYWGSDRTLEFIDRETLRNYARFLFDDRRLKETTVKRRMATLKVLFKWLEREEAIDLSPFHRLDLAIRLPRRLPRALAFEDMRKLLDRADFEAQSAGGIRNHFALLLQFSVICLFITGLRVGELVGATIGDVDPLGASILVRGKGDRERRVYLAGRYGSVALDRYLAQRRRCAPTCDRLLVRGTGAPMTTQALRRAVAALAKRAGISRHVTPHMLRHTAATQLIEAGVDIRFVQKLLGHASIATTQIYTQVTDASLRATLDQADTLRRLKTRRKG